MSWQLINSIKNKTDLRLVLPFGMSLELGDVVSVGKDGNLTLEARCTSILGLDPGPVTAMGQNIDIMSTSDKGVQVTFRAAGQASSISKMVPAGNAGFDLTFGEAESWILAIGGRQFQALEVNRLRRPILEAYKRGVWRADWAVVTAVATVQSMTLIASTSANAKVALTMGADVADTAALEAKLTADISIAYSNQQLTQCVIKKQTVAFCRGLRVRDPWWRGPDVVVLDRATVAAPNDPIAASDEKFWEDVDTIPTE